MSSQELFFARQLRKALTKFEKGEIPFVALLGTGNVQERILKCNRIGVLPGTFDPPTSAHEEMARWALKNGGCDGILLLLDLRHADKGSMEAHLIDRCIMTRLAFGRSKRIFIGLSSHGRFSDKRSALEGLLGEKKGWVFLIGSDTLARILNPVFYEDPERELGALFEKAEFVVFRRPGWDDVTEGPFENSKISWVKLPSELESVSSSGIRQRRRSAAEWTMWVKPEVAIFIQRTGLYLPGFTPYTSRRHWLEGLVGLL